MQYDDHLQAPIMIRCAICGNRVRPPTRPWQQTKDGGVHFYHTTSDMGDYTKWLGRLAKIVAFVHEDCAEAAEPGTLPATYMVAQDLDIRLRNQQRKGRRNMNLDLRKITKAVVLSPVRIIQGVVDAGDEIIYGPKKSGKN